MQQADNARRGRIEIPMPELPAGLRLALREMPQVLSQVQVRQLRLRGTLALGSYLVRVKVMPSGPEVPSEKLLQSVTKVLGNEMAVKGSKVDPIAFGLYALIIDIIAPEEEGMVDKVEAAVSKAPLVTQSELLGVSRMSSHLKV